MYEAMTRAYNESNARFNKENWGKIYNYSLLNKDYMEVETGKCKNVIYRYDPCYDYNIVSFIDIETDKRYSVCQFFVKIKDITE